MAVIDVLGRMMHLAVEDIDYIKSYIRINPTDDLSGYIPGVGMIHTAYSDDFRLQKVLISESGHALLDFVLNIIGQKKIEINLGVHEAYDRIAGLIIATLSNKTLPDLRDNAAIGKVFIAFMQSVDTEKKNPEQTVRLFEEFLAKAFHADYALEEIKRLQNKARQE